MRLGPRSQARPLAAEIMALGCGRCACGRVEEDLSSRIGDVAPARVLPAWRVSAALAGDALRRSPTKNQKNKKKKKKKKKVRKLPAPPPDYAAMRPPAVRAGSSKRWAVCRAAADSL